MAVLVLALVVLLAHAHPQFENQSEGALSVKKILDMLRANVDKMDAESQEKLFHGMMEFANLLTPKLGAEQHKQLGDIPGAGPVLNYFFGFVSGYSGANIPDIGDVIQNCQVAPSGFTDAVQRAQEDWQNNSGISALKDLVSACSDAYNAIQSCCQYMPSIKKYCNALDDIAVSVIGQLALKLTPIGWLDWVDTAVKLGTQAYSIYGDLKGMWNNGQVSYYKLGSLVGRLVDVLDVPGPVSEQCKSTLSSAADSMPPNANAITLVSSLYQEGALNICYAAFN